MMDYFKFLFQFSYAHPLWIHNYAFIYEIFPSCDRLIEIGLFFSYNLKYFNFSDCIDDIFTSIIFCKIKFCQNWLSPHIYFGFFCDFLLFKKWINQYSLVHKYYHFIWVFWKFKFLIFHLFDQVHMKMNWINFWFELIKASF